MIADLVASLIGSVPSPSSPGSPRSPLGRHALSTGLLVVTLAVVAVAVLIGSGHGGASHHASMAGSSARLPRTVRASAPIPDPEAANSFPEAAGTTHAAAITPAQAAVATTIAPGAPSDAQVRQELAQMKAAIRAQQTVAASGAAIDSSGAAHAPSGTPLVIARVIAGANAIANFPYRYGGGHGSFVDNAYDCSGSLSYALAAGGLVSATLTSGDFENWGVPGPGRWISVYATAGHTYMYVAGLRFDTSGRSGPLGSRWQAAARDNSGFVVRHWPGL